MERQKQENNHDRQQKKQLENHNGQELDKEDHHQTVVLRVPGAHNTPATKKHTSSTATTPLKKQMSVTSSKTTAVEGDEQHQPTVSRVGRTATTMSMKKHTSSTEPISTTLRKEVTSISSNSAYSQENEQHHGYQPQVIQVPRSGTTMSLRKQISSDTFKHSNVDSSATLKGVHLNASQTSSNPFASSSINLIPKSEIFDQDSYLNDTKSHARKNDAKRHGKINISGGEK